MDRRYPSAPQVGVAAVVWRDDRVLLVRRARPPRKGEWSLPGGLQKLGETVFEAACREVLEETRVRVRGIGLVDVVDLVDREPDNGRIVYHYTLVDVLAEWTDGEPVAADDAAEAAWVAATDIAGLGLWSETERVIAKARQMWLARRSFS